MPRYLVTLRHAETGETCKASVWGEDQGDAMFRARDAVNSEEDIINAAHDVWFPDHACPADDVPVPGRDR